MLVALAGRTKAGQEATTESYFLAGRNLRWTSVAMSTIVTNIQGYQFLGMMGSAYLYGLAQASLKINAVQGIMLAAFLFVPMYLSERVITITQFIEKKVGPKVALAYSLANLAFSTITLGGFLDHAPHPSGAKPPPPSTAPAQTTKAPNPPAPPPQ